MDDLDFLDPIPYHVKGNAQCLKCKEYFWIQSLTDKDLRFYSDVWFERYFHLIPYDYCSECDESTASSSSSYNSKEPKRLRFLIERENGMLMETYNMFFTGHSHESIRQMLARMDPLKKKETHKQLSITSFFNRK